MKNRVAFYTLGCRLNQSETAVIQNTFELKGYEIVNRREPADIAVINTCTVTEHGDADTRKLVNKINRLNPEVRIALIGCQAQVQQNDLVKMPNVHWVVGTAKKMDLASIINEDAGDLDPKVIITKIPTESFKISFPGKDRQHTRANLKIQDGCDYFCSYCVIPFARGRARSREFDDVVKEANALTTAGHKEIVLTGINVGCYKEGGKEFIDVLSALEKITELQRIRISSIEPTTLPDEVLDKINKSPKICRHLHIPMQSGDNDILKRMNRKYSVQEFKALIEKAHNLIPGLCIGIDVIVGFPGETEEHFKNTLNVCKELPVQYFHIFSYSKRRLAKSSKLLNVVDKEVVRNRSRILRELGVKKREQFLKDSLKKTQSVLFEQKKEECWRGLTDNYIRVDVHSQQSLSNQILPVNLEENKGQFIMGSIAQE